MGVGIKNRLIVLYIAALALHFVLALWAGFYYQGELGVFGIFSAIYLLNVLAIFRTWKSPTLFFLGLMLYLGFFVKITYHLVAGNPFVEPTGYFRGLPTQWDEVLMAASYGVSGYLLVQVLVNRLGKWMKLRELSEVIQDNLFKSSYVKFLFAFVVIFILAMVFLNNYLGILISGIVPKTILHWPLNTVITWILSIGLALTVLVLMELEFKKYGRIKYSLWLMIFQAFIVSVSTLSRGLFLFHTLPLLYLIIRNRKFLRYSYLELGKLISILIVFFMISFSSVSILRKYVYETQSPDNNISYLSFLKLQGSGLFNNIVVNQLSRMVIDRWMGAEGLMAVVGYPEEKSFDFMATRLVYKPAAGEADIYSKMTNTIYAPDSKYAVTSIPGPMAFFYYSGNFKVVGIGMFLLVLIFLGMEIIVDRVFGNPFLTVFMSFLFANHISQFGIFPRQLFVFYMMTSLALAFYYFANRAVMAKISA